MTQATLQSAGFAELLQQVEANAAQVTPAAHAVPAASNPQVVQQQQPIAQTTSALPGLPGGQPVQTASAIPPGAIEIELSEPVTVRNGVVVDTIYLRQPTLGDWLDCGDLMQATAIDGEGGAPKVDVRVDPQAAGKWFSKLSGQSMRYFRSMSLKDWRRIMNHLQTIAGDAGSENPMI